MESDLCGIGELARASGLTVSALRFYDRAGVLVPAFVDPQTGYRWYHPDQVQTARIVAGLRRVGLPLPSIIQLLAHRADRATVRGLLAAHRRRLEDGLADARRELSRVHALLDHEENTMTMPGPATRLTLASRQFARALDAVRFAVSDDPDQPAIGGVLLELDDDALRLIATDRYRLAVAQAPARRTAGPRASVVVPADLFDRARSTLLADADLTLALDGTDVRLRSAAGQVDGRCLDVEFPDYRRLLHPGDPQRVPVDVAELRQRLATGATRRVVREQDGVTCEVSVLTLDGEGQVAVAPPDAAEPTEAAEPIEAAEPTGAAAPPEATGPAGPLRIGVNREFLLEALAAAGQGQLVLELDGPIAPLALRRPDDDSAFTILMPIRL